MKPIWLANLKKFVTGTSVGGKYAIDVNVANSITASLGSAAFKEARFHDASITGWNGVGGAWVQIDANSAVASATPANVANTCTSMKANWNGGTPVMIGKGANAGAVTQIAQLGAGESDTVGVTLSSGDKLWVKSVESAAVTDGKLSLKLLG